MDTDADRFSQLVRGVCPVVEVPFTPDEAVDETSFAGLVDHLAGTGVTSLMFPGFASEFHKLTEGERFALLRILVERAGRPQLAVIASVADDSTRLACVRAVAAIELGADAVNLLPPFRVTPAPAELVRHIRAVAAAIAPAPLILQHAPALTGVPLSVDTIASIARDRPNLRMVKVEAVPPGTMISGLAEVGLPAMVGYGGVMMIDALRRGAVGVQPGCSVTELYLRVWRSWAAGDHWVATRLHQRMLPYLAYWMQSVDLIVAVEKTISMRRGLISHDVCRHPSRSLDAQETGDVDRFLRELGDLLT